MIRPGVSLLTPLPNPDFIPAAWFKSFVRLKFGAWPNLGFHDEYGHDVALNRNNLVMKALDSPAEWFLWLDADQTMPTGALWRLLSWDKKIVAACVFTKGTGSRNLPVFYKQSVRTDKEGVYQPCFDAVLRFHYKHAHIAPMEEDGVILPAQGALLEVDAVGFGCILTHRSVFEKMEKPWFSWTKSGEDMYFCRKATKLGYKVYGDMGCVVGHKQMGTVTHLSFLNKYAHIIEREARGEIPKGDIDEMKLFAPMDEEKESWFDIMETEDA